MLKNKKIGMLLFLTISITSAIFSGCGATTKAANAAPSSDTIAQGKKPKYVFLFIGDGMGIPQVNSAEIYNGAIKNPSNPQIDKLSFSKFPAEGMNTTYAADSFIPDSASAGTAIATGHKTNDGVIAMDPSKTTSYSSIAKLAQKKGMKVGIVTSVSIDHATPAVFYANEPSRNDYYSIALQLGKSNFNYFGGGGFLQPTGAKKDKPDAFKEAEKNGYKVAKTKDDFNKLTSKDSKVIAVSPKLDDSQAIPFAINNDPDTISLADFTQKGIDLLDNKNGFFMMVEGGKIDWACHANDAAASIKDTVALSDAVQKAIDFYNKHKDETLILVTADHETGGMTLGFAGTEYQTFFKKISNEKVSYDVFTDKVKDYAKSHTPDNAKLEDLYPLIKESYGLEPMDANTYNELEKKSKDTASSDSKDAEDKIGMALSPSDISSLRDALKLSVTNENSRPKDDQTYLLYGDYDPLTVTLTHILNHKAGLSFTSYAHTGVPIPTFAEGACKELFKGYFDDTEIFKKLKSAMGV